MVHLPLSPRRDAAGVVAGIGEIDAKAFALFREALFEVDDGLPGGLAGKVLVRSDLRHHCVPSLDRAVQHTVRHQGVKVDTACSACVLFNVGEFGNAHANNRRVAATLAVGSGTSVTARPIPTPNRRYSGNLPTHHCR